nr:hypothetical protein [Nostoc sp. ChiSLP03a]
MRSLPMGATHYRTRKARTHPTHAISDKPLHKVVGKCFWEYSDRSATKLKLSTTKFTTSIAKLKVSTAIL